MAAVTRWVNYDISAVGSSAVDTATGGVGTVGYSFGKGTIASGITIGPTTNRLYLTLDGSYQPTDPVDSVAGYITITSGTNLDPRFVARDITEKLHASAATERFTHAKCVWEDCYKLDVSDYWAWTAFKIYSGTRGSASSVTVATSGTNSAHVQLGFSVGNVEAVGGTPYSIFDPAAGNNFTGTVTVTGTYYGFFDEEYMITINNDDPHSTTRGVARASIDTSNLPYISNGGTLGWGGIYNGNTDRTYRITINVTNGTTMGAGRGNVPRMQWTVDTGTADNMKTAGGGEWIELLYPNYWYSLGTMGVKVKFEVDANFGSGGYVTIPCYKPDYAEGTNSSAPIGTARMLVASTRGDYIDAHVATPASGTSIALGDRGLYITFSGANNLSAGDEFRVACAGPNPSSPWSSANYDISSLNYGNVTVSTESALKCVLFEIESGAEVMSTVKFGLQSNGTFSHHDAGNNDTYFRFGTVGPANTPTSNSYEWYPDIPTLNIDTPPAYLYAVDKDLAEVSTADASESVGNSELAGLTSDPMWVSITLGASETGANSTINYRLYFDYS
ncbi:MAG: hypothetical protein ACXADW_10550 [Candidatus Hodarchaeales archaeon]|jgi:hypothetical protein